MTDLGSAGVAGPDQVARGVIVLGPLSVAALVYFRGGSVSAPGALLSGVALLTGVFLSAFTHVAVLRQRLTERASEYPDAERPDRDFLDESATHLLTAALLAGTSAGLLVIAMNFADSSGAVTGLFAASVCFLTSYVFLLFLMTVPKLYYVYVSQNNVRERLRG